ncbi:MAG: hypothetical protein K8T10_10945 [Candidatus Eremiobacteraeota bacterium]|nr:hypothetical protein [Candidatus Eremiobacteraeota bacterium]
MKSTDCKPAGKFRYGNLSRGLSLLEVIISLGIASVAILTMLLFFAYALENIRIGKSVGQATAIAQRHMESLKAKGKEVLAEMADSGGESTQVSEVETLYDPGTNTPLNYTITYSVVRLPPPQERVLDIVVRVDWEYQDAPKNLVLESYVNSRY